MDDHNHGTHCSGTIAGVGNNGVGVVGINWTAKIMALKFLGSNGSGSTSDAVLQCFMQQQWEQS
jgi:subtilisin family serine protease